MSRIDDEAYAHAKALKAKHKDAVASEWFPNKYRAGSHFYSLTPVHTPEFVAEVARRVQAEY